MGNIVNPANAVTASRFITIPPFIYCVDQGLYQWAGVLVVLCAVGDLFDGAVARAFNCSSGFGELFDAVADGVCYGTFLVTLVGYGWVPWEPVGIIVALGVVNAVMRAAYVRRAGKTTNYRSFAMERVVAYAAYLCGFGTTGFQVSLFFWGCAVLMAIVVVHDAKRMLLDPVPA